MAEKTILQEAKEVFAGAVELRADRFGKMVPELTTSQLRKFLNEVVRIGNRIEILKAKRLQAGDQSNDLPEELKDEAEFLDVKLMYQVGRDKPNGPVKRFYEKGEMSAKIADAAKGIKEFERFADLMEAIVALHKYHGGKD